MSIISSPWEDLGATTAQAAGIRRPINIKRSAFEIPRMVSTGDSMRVEFSNHRGEVTDRTPDLPVDKPMFVDAIVKFEVEDEFGCDVGIGFVLCGRRR